MCLRMFLTETFVAALVYQGEIYTEFCVFTDKGLFRHLMLSVTLHNMNTMNGLRVHPK